MNKNDIINDFIIREGIISDIKQVFAEKRFKSDVVASAKYLYAACLYECGWERATVPCIMEKLKKVISILKIVKEKGCEAHSGNKFYGIHKMTLDECQRFTHIVTFVLERVLEDITKNKRKMSVVPSDMFSIISQDEIVKIIKAKEGNK